MPLTDRPPVADSYDTLQGIAHVNRVYDIACDCRVSDDCHLALLAGGLQLTMSNLVSLNNSVFERFHQPHPPEDAYKSGAQHLLWIRDLLYLSVDIATHMRSAYYERVATNVTLAGHVSGDSLFGFQESIDATSKASSAISQAISGTDIRAQCEYGSQFGPLSNMLHMCKVNFHLLRTLSGIVSSLSVPAEVNSQPWVDALKNAVSTPQLPGGSYLQQFRLLHQIPELLSRRVVSIIQTYSATPDLDASVECARAIRSCVSLTDLAIGCIRPLANELLPADYKKIRHYLGVTSGSESQVISKTLLRGTLADIFRMRSHLESKRRTVTRRAVMLALFELGELLTLWRDLHLMFPRNVLGAGMVRSLIGSKEASQAAEVYATTHIATAHTFSTLCPRTIARVQADSLKGTSAERLDQRLLEALGQATKSNFTAVQERTGIFRKTASEVDNNE